MRGRVTRRRSPAARDAELQAVRQRAAGLLSGPVVRPGNAVRACMCIMLAALAVGCSNAGPACAAPQEPNASEPSALSEEQVLAIARDAVAANDTWVERAEFEKPQRNSAGWSVWVW